MFQLPDQRTRVDNRAHVINSLQQLVPVLVKNVSGSTAPPYSMGEVSSSSTTNGVDGPLIGNDIVLSFGKPTLASTELYIATGPVSIPNGKTGPGYVGSVLPFKMSADIGDFVSPTPNSFVPTVSGSGPLIVYAKDAATGVVLTKHSGGSQASQHRLMRFRIKTRLGGGVWSAVVTVISANAPIDVVLGRPPVVGDEVLVHDPNNLFPDIVADDDQSISAFTGGSTGTAYWREPEISGNMPVSVSRWEIETCSIPIDEVRVWIDSCLLAFNSTGHVGNMRTTDFKRSSGYGAVDIPPEFYPHTAVSGFAYGVNFDNPLHLHAVKDSYVYLRRYGDATPSDPHNVDLPHPYDPGNFTWYVVRVEKPIARFVCTEKLSDSQWLIGSWWDGFDPRQCVTGFDTSCFDMTCVAQGDNVLGTYDPMQNKYRLSGGRGIGAPVPVSMPSGRAYFVCDQESGNFCLEQDVVTRSMFVCNTPPATTVRTTLVCVDSVAFLHCLNICEYICTYCPEYSAEAFTCDGECCLDCEFPEVNPITDMDFTDTVNSAAQSGDSIKIDDCTFSVPMDNDTVWVVTYLGDGDWSIDFELGGSGGTAIGTGDCTFGTDFSSAANPNFEGDLSAAGDDCGDPPPDSCCGDCLFTSPFVSALQIVVGGVPINQDGAATKTGDCDFLVPMDDGSTVAVNYGGTAGVGAWTVTGETIPGLTGDGGCAGSSNLSGTDATGSVSMTGVDCPTCCPDSWQPTVTIENFGSGPGPEIGFYQVPGTVVRNGCTFEVPVDVYDFDGGVPVVMGSGTAFITYDAETGIWTVTTTPESTGGDFDLLGGFYVDPGTCCGQQDCPNSDCMDDTFSPNGGVFQVINCSI